MMRRAGSGIVVTPRQAELSLCWHLHAMRPSGPPPGGLTAPCTHSRSNQIKPRNCACRSPISMVCLPLADSSLISSKREHPITLFHSQPALRGRTRDLRHARTFGSTEHGIAYRPRKEGDGVAVVVRGRESLAKGHRCSTDGCGGSRNGNSRKLSSRQGALESRMTLKGSCPVWGGGVGKVPQAATRRLPTLRHVRFGGGCALQAR